MSSESLAYLIDPHHPVQLLDEERDKVSHVIQVHATYDRQLREHGPPFFLGEGLLEVLPHVRTAEYALEPLHRLGRQLLRVAADAGQHEDACLELVLHSDHSTRPPSVREQRQDQPEHGDKIRRRDVEENSEQRLTKTERRIS